MRLGSVHWLRVVGSLEGKRLQSHRLLKTWVGCGEEERDGEPILPRP